MLQTAARPQFSFLVFCSLITFPLLFFPQPVKAAIPDISGYYTGSMTGNDINCIPNATDGPFSNTITFTITQSGSAFTASGSFIDQDAFVGTFNFLNATVDSGGNISGDLTVQSDVPGSGTFTGSFSGGQLILNISGQDNSYGAADTCQFTATGTATRSNSTTTIVNPEITPSNILTEQILLNMQVRAIVGDISTRTSNVLRGLALGINRTSNGFMYQAEASGLNAGDLSAGYGIWGSVSYSDFNNNFSSTAFDGDRLSFLTGVDISPWENIVMGIAVGYEGSDIDTRFNGGNQNTDGYTVAPYFGYLLGDGFSADATLGYTRIESDQYRTSGLTRVTSSPSSNRFFGAFNLNTYTVWQDWILSGRTGMLYAINKTDSFTESDSTFVSNFRSKLGQWNIGGEAAYSFGEFEPFVRLSYEYDFSATQVTLVAPLAQPSNDNDNFLFGAGLRYFASNGLTGNFEWSKRLARDNYEEDTFTATLRMEF